MDPVSIIAAAIIAGATAAASETASQAIKDAYQALKTLLVEGYKFASAGLLERKPSDPVFRQAVENELTSSPSIAADKAILEKTKALQEALRTAPSSDLAAWGVDVMKIDAARDFIAERISRTAGGLRAEEIRAGGDVRFSDISGSTIISRSVVDGAMNKIGDRSDTKVERTIDAHLIAPSFVHGQIVTLTVTLRLPKSELLGQFKGVALLSQDDGPVNVHLEAQGFTIVSEPPPPLTLVANRDSAPAAFQLRIEDNIDRWLHIIIMQSGRVAGELVINQFDSLTSEKLGQASTPMMFTQDADLAVIIQQDAAIISSPRNRACRFFERIPGIKPLAMPFRAMLQSRLKALYDSSGDPETTARELKIVGVELARCLSQELTGLLRRTDVRIVLLRHDENFDFPLELCYIDDDVDPFFVGDCKVICRWFLGIANPPDVVEKRIRRVAFLRGLDKAATIDERTLTANYPNRTTTLTSLAAVRNQLFMSSDFDLIQFTGHCEITEAGVGGLQMADGSFVRMIDVGQLKTEREFARAQPFVLLNACTSAQPYVSAIDKDSFAHRFITSQACAFIGTLWPVAGAVANDFADAFHLAMKEKTVASALLAAKLAIVEKAKQTNEGDTSVLAIAQQVAARSYCLFAHPDLRLAS